MDVRFPRSLATLTIATLILAGCGVDFSSGEPGTEFFKSLKVTGTPMAGAQMTMLLAYAQNYPVDVTVKCEVRQGKDLVKEVGSQIVPQLAGGGPKATPVTGTYSFDFTVDRPGAYKAECYTPADENNYIIREFSIRPAAAGG
jgi:hypothetical protein